LHNKYSVLSIDKTDDVENNDDHRKGVEVSKTPISPKRIFKRPEKMAEKSESYEKKNEKDERTAGCASSQGEKKSNSQNWINTVDPWSVQWIKTMVDRTQAN
jgi:hypothetical protein